MGPFAESWVDILGFFVSIGALIALVYYVVYTKRMAIANQEMAVATNANVEYGMRPVIGVMLHDISAQTHLWLSVRNFSNTDAVGLVILRIYANTGLLSLNDPAYDGAEFWHLPAMQEQVGHKEFSGLLKGANIQINSSLALSAEAFVYYKPWSTSESEIRNSRRYFAPVKRWDYDARNNRWVPVLTSKQSIKHPEPNWATIEGNR